MTDLNQMATDAQPDLELQRLDGKFFSNRTSRWTALMSTPQREAGVFCKLAPDGYVYELQHPTFIGDVEFTGDASTKRPLVKVEIIPISDNPPFAIRTRPHSTKPNVVVATIGEIIRGFRVSKDGWFALTETFNLSEVAAYGLSLGDLEGIESDLRQFFEGKDKFADAANALIDQINAKANALAADKTAFDAEQKKGREALAAEAAVQTARLSSEVTAHKTKVEELDAEIEEKKEELATVAGEVAATQEKVNAGAEKCAEAEKQLTEKRILLEQTERKDADLQQRISEKDSELKLKTDKTTALNDKLQELNRNSSLFSEDIVSAGKLGDAQIGWNLRWVVIPCLVILAALTTVVMISNWDLLHGNFSHPGMTFLEVIGLKIAGGAIVVGVFHYLTKLTVPSLHRIIAIQAAQQDLKRVSILAGDIVSSATYAVHMSDEEKLDLRIKVRADFVRSQLCGEFDRPKPGGRALLDIFRKPKFEASVKAPTVAVSVLAAAEHADGPQTPVGNT